MISISNTATPVPSGPDQGGGMALTRRQFVGGALGAALGGWLWTPLAAHAQAFVAASPPTDVGRQSVLGTLLAAGAAGALSLVLEFPDPSSPSSVTVKGNSAAAGHAGTVDLLGVSLGAKNAVTIGSASGGAALGKASFSAIRIQKTFDSASTALFTALTGGEHFPRVLLYVGQVGAANSDLFYELGTVVVTSIDVEAATGDSAATETVEMVFGAMEIDYTPAGASPLVAGWDQVANKPVNLPDVAPPAPAAVPPAPASVWMIATSGTGNHPILHYAQPTASWITTDGLAVRVAVGSDGRPWVVNAAGAIFRRLAGPTSYDDGSWQYVSGIAASDIGVGADGSVWIVDTAAVNGGHGIWVMTSAPGSGPSVVGIWRQIDGAAVAVSVGPDGQPFVVNGAGNVFSRARGGSTNSYVDGAWVSLPGLATDIGVGADGSAFVIGANATLGGFGVWKLASGTWQAITGFNGGVRIAVDSHGEPVVVDKSGTVWFYQAAANVWNSLGASSTALDVGVGNA